MNVLITLSTAGASTGPTFNLYSDVDTYATPFETGVAKSALVSGYTSTLVPNAATMIRVQSVGTCTNYGLFPIAGVTTTTTTTAGGGGTTTTTTTAGGGTTTTTTTAGGGGTTTTTTTTIAPFDYYYADKYECPDCIVLESNVVVKFPPGTTVLTNKNYISFSGDFNYRITGPAPYTAFSNQMQTVPYDNCNAVCNPVTTTTTTTIAPSACYNYNAFNNNEEPFTLSWTDCDGTPRTENVPASSLSSTFCAEAGSVVGFNFTINVLEPCGSPATTTTTTTVSGTTTTTTTGAPGPTTTTTTTSGINHPYEFPITSGYSDEVSACNEGNTATTIWGDSPQFLVNTVYYTTQISNIPYDGSSLYYKNTANNQFVQIDSNGQKLSSGNC
jgi:hypothetical protein